MPFGIRPGCIGSLPTLEACQQRQDQGNLSTSTFNHRKFSFINRKTTTIPNRANDTKTRPESFDFNYLLFIIFALATSLSPFLTEYTLDETFYNLSDGNRFVSTAPDAEAARAETDHATKMRQSLDPTQPSNGLNTSPGILSRPSETTPIREQNLPFLTPIAPQPQPPPQPITSFASTLTSAEEEHKKAAAAVAAKLRASSSSAQVFSSILSSLAAEEAASMNGFSASPPLFQAEKKPRLEKPISVSDMSTGPYFGPQPPAQTNQASSSAFPPLPPPPRPPLPPLPMQQFVKTGLMVGLLPQGYSGNSLPPPPPLSSHVGLARPSGPPPPPPLPPPPQQQQQLQSASTGFYPPPGLGFYGQVQPTPPAQRQ